MPSNTRRTACLLVALSGAGCDIFAALGGGDGLPCSNDRSCPTYSTCVAGRCQQLAICETDSECPAGFRCDPTLRVCLMPSDASVAEAGAPDRGRDAAPPDRGGMRDAATGDRTIDDGGRADLPPPDNAGQDLAATGDAGSGDRRDAADAAVNDARVSDRTVADIGVDHPVDDAGQPDAILYQQDFSGATADLVPDDGTWGLDQGVLRQTEVCTGNVDCHIMARTFGDIVVSVDFRFDDYCLSALKQAGVLVRAQSSGGCDNQYYLCVADLDGDDLFLGKLDGACQTTPDDSASTAPLDTGTWYQMTVAAIGDMVVCTLAGTSLPQTYTVARQYPGTTWLNGGVGLLTSGAASSFDNLKVEAR